MLQREIDIDLQDFHLITNRINIQVQHSSQSPIREVKKDLPMLVDLIRPSALCIELMKICFLSFSFLIIEVSGLACTSINSIRHLLPPTCILQRLGQMEGVN